MTPEGRIKQAVKAVLKERGVLYFMPVQQGYGAPSLDFLCWTKAGYPFAVETKAGFTKKPTQRQYVTAMGFIAHGVPAFLIRGKNARDAPDAAGYAQTCAFLDEMLMRSATISHVEWKARLLGECCRTWRTVMRSGEPASEAINEAINEGTNEG